VNAPQITVVGHLAREPKLRTLAGGTVVADFRIGSTPSRIDRATGQWSDLPTMWFGVSCWRTLGEHAAMSLKTGDRVIVTGRLTMRTWTNDQGEERSGWEIDASSVGMDLSRGPVTQYRVSRPQTAAESEATDDADWPAQEPPHDPITGELLDPAPEPEVDTAAA